MRHTAEPLRDVHYWAARVFLLSLTSRLNNRHHSTECEYRLAENDGVLDCDGVALELASCRKPVTCEASLDGKTIHLLVRPLAQAESENQSQQLIGKDLNKARLFDFLLAEHPAALEHLLILCRAKTEQLAVSVESVETYYRDYKRDRFDTYGVALIDSPFAALHKISRASAEGAEAVLVFERTQWFREVISVLLAPLSRSRKSPRP